MASNKDGTMSPGRLLLCGGKGLAIGVIAAAILLFILSCIAYGMKDPGMAVEPMGYASLIISSGITGIAAARFSHETGSVSALFGGCAGAMMLALLLIMSFIPTEAPPKPLSPFITVIMYAAVPAIAALSGFVFRKKKSKKPLHRRRR